ncbi:MAG: Dabb family protein [Stomatobaculum sp.]|nr:Dabb family protein [Stomatobaculum sp.]
MIKHINLWKFKEDLSEEEKASVRLGMKEAFESLPGRISGMTSCVIRTEFGPASNADCMMECTFENMEALEAYRKNPLHTEIAVIKVRPYTIDRLGVDFEI